MFGLLIDYWAFTGDESYVNETFDAMQHQATDAGDYQPANQTSTEGNDDQGFWALAAMSAAEMGFKDPGDDGAAWLASAQAIFNEYSWRWDNTTCGGGLRWQISYWMNGYDYKNSVANGCFFDLSARLALYTGNQTYADWAVKIYDWMSDIGFLDDEGNVYDGAEDDDDCSAVVKVQWTYNAGLFMEGSAAMYNYTNGSSLWRDRVDALVNRSSVYFFNNSIMYEPPCEPESSCTTDSFSFKAYLVRWMAKTTQLAPWTYDAIYPLLLASGKAAALQCDGTATASHGAVLDGNACGQHWVWGSQNDGTAGVGQQMSGLAAVFFTLVERAPSPYTSNTGGTSVGDPSGGSTSSGSSSSGDDIDTRTITTADKAGAGIVTTLMVGIMGGSLYWLTDGFQAFRKGQQDRF